METLLARGGFYFLIGLVLALLEIQIEGKHGWAEKLPTWRWRVGFMHRPITGYLVCMNLFLLLLLHSPIAHAGFSIALEAEILSFYFLLCVFWDFQWFAWNPHYGVAGFRKGNVWWYRTWVGRFPLDYYTGLATAAVLYILPAAFGSGAWGARAMQWGALVVEFVLLTLVSMAFARLAVARAPEGQAA